MKKRDLKTVIYCYNTGNSKMRSYLRRNYDKNLLKFPYKSITKYKHCIEFIFSNSKSRYEIYKAIDLNTQQGLNDAKKFIFKTLNYFAPKEPFTYKPEIIFTKDVLDNPEKVDFLGKVENNGDVFNCYCTGYMPVDNGGFNTQEIAKHYVKYFWKFELPVDYKVI